MGKLRGFLEHDRRDAPERDPRKRVGDYREFVRTLPLVELRDQGARCMECGVPFCHSGCPLGNLIPDWNDLVYRDHFREAIDQLHRTNNFPEFTGRLCPAPCEAACVLEIEEGNAVSIKQIEVAIVNRAWEEGWIQPQPPGDGRAQTVAVIGAGPAGLACAQQLNRAGHSVTVFERDEAGGGLVRFGVPDFKIEKRIVERRLEQLAAEGIELRYGLEVGVDVPVDELPPGLRRRRPRDRLAGARATFRSPAASSAACTSRWSTCTNATASWPRARAAPRSAAAGRADQRRGEARDRDRRRRHGRRLRRQRAPRGRRVGDADRARRRAAAEPARRRHAVAALADEAAHVLRTEGGRRARLRDHDDPVHRQRPRSSRSTGRRTRRAALRAGRRHRGGAPRGARAAGDGLPVARAAASRRSSASRAMPAATPTPRPTRPPSTASSPQAMRAAASR